MNTSDYCVVIGGANVDIGGMPYTDLIPRDSNPGRIFNSMGGVGRNIAHNLRLLGVNVRFITAVGNDTNGHMIIDSCNRLGMDISSIHMSARYSTSTYMFIADKDGDMQLAVSDMSITDSITPSVIKDSLSVINNAALVVVDANIPTETISYIAENCTVPIYAEPVSSAKAARMIPGLEHFAAVKPNAIEARVLSGVEITDDASLKECADAIIAQGVEKIFLSMGDRGVYAADKNGGFLLPCLPCEVRNTTGAGDAMMAGLAYGYMSGRPLKEQAMLGLAAAAISIEGTSTINNKLTAASCLEKAGLA